MDFDGRDAVLTIHNIEYEVNQRPRLDADGVPLDPRSRRYESWPWRYQWEGRQAFVDREDTFKARQLRAAGLPHDQPTWQEGFREPLERSVTDEDIRIDILRRFDEIVRMTHANFSPMPRLHRKGIKNGKRIL